MATDELVTYLNDHLAGSVAAVSVLDRLTATAEEPGERQFFEQLQREIQEDKGTLEELIQKVGGSRSAIRQAGAWLSEMLTAVKMRIDDPGGRRLNYLEALEILAIGILGKRALWRVLGAASADVGDLRALDYERLERRAQEQHDRVDARRIAAGRRVFSTAPDEATPRSA